MQQVRSITSVWKGFVQLGFLISGFILWLVVSCGQMFVYPSNCQTDPNEAAASNERRPVAVHGIMNCNLLHAHALAVTAQHSNDDTRCDVTASSARAYSN